MAKSDNIDHDREETPQSDPAETLAETNGSYYYDDATGYEVFTEEDSDEESKPPDSEDESS